MLSYLARRFVYTLPILLGVALVCFALVHIAPGDPLVSVLPPDASADLQKMMLAIYGFDRPYCRAVREVAVAGAARRPRLLDRDRPAGRPTR